MLLSYLRVLVSRSLDRKIFVSVHITSKLLSVSGFRSREEVETLSLISQVRVLVSEPDQL